MKKVLVTGAYGFIGRHTSKYFSDKGWYVSGIGHGTWVRDEWKTWGISEWKSADVNLDNLITYGEAPDMVIHCAGSGSVPFSMTHPAQDFQRTVQTTADVLEFIRLYAPLSGIVIPSSAAVYGAADRLPIHEETPCYPISPYGFHKQMSEDLARSYASFFGVKTTVIRFFSVYGPGLRKQLLWDACNKFAQGKGFFWGSGEETRDWLHVWDAAKLLYTISAYADHSCPVFNGASGEGIPVRRVIETVRAAMGSNISIDFTHGSKGGDPSHYVADVQKITKLGFTLETDWREGVAEYVRWFKTEK